LIRAFAIRSTISGSGEALASATESGRREKVTTLDQPTPRSITAKSFRPERCNPANARDQQNSSVATFYTRPLSSRQERLDAQSQKKQECS
jgi:hypothetical protein